MPDKVKSTFINPLDYPDCTSFCLTDLTLDPAVPVNVSTADGTLTIRMSKNNTLDPPAYLIKIWDNNGQEPADPSMQAMTRMLLPLKGSTAMKAVLGVKKKAYASAKTAKKKTVVKKKTAAKKKKR